MPSQEAVDVTILVRTINQIFDEPLPNPLPNPEDPSRLGEHTDPSEWFHFLLDSNHLDFKSDRRPTVFRARIICENCPPTIVNSAENMNHCFIAGLHLPIQVTLY